MTVAATVNKWQKEDKTVSISIRDGCMWALVFTGGGEPYTVKADDFGDLVVQIDNLLEDKVFKNFRRLSVVPEGI